MILFMIYEKRLLPNDVFLLRNIGEDHKGYGGVLEVERTNVGVQVMMEAQSNSS